MAIRLNKGSQTIPSLIILFILLTAGMAVGQDFYGGIIAGSTRNEIRLPDSSKAEYDSEAKTGYQFYLAMEYWQYEYAALQLGLRFARSGGTVLLNDETMDLQPGTITRSEF